MALIANGFRAGGVLANDSRRSCFSKALRHRSTGRSALFAKQRPGAPEIGGDFYPNSDAACTEPADASVTANDNDEVVSRIRELTYRLGYNRAKTKMLLGRWAKALLGLERSLLNEVEDSAEESPDSLVAASGGEGCVFQEF